MLADRAAADQGLPMVVLKCCTDFDIDLQRLINVDNRQEGESDSQVVTRYIDEICDSLTSPEFAGIAEKIQSVITAFSDRIKGATNSIKDIRATAKELAEYMDKGKTEYLAKDPYVATHLNLTNVSVDFPTWEWNGPKLLGGSTYIKERVGGQIVGKGIEPPQDFDYRKFVNGCETISTKTTLEPVDAQPEVIEKVVDATVDALGGESTKEEVADVVAVLFGVKSVRGYVLNLERIVGMSPADLFSRVKEYDQFICKHYPVVEAVVEGHVAIPEACAEKVKENAEKLRTICEFMAYFEAMERETVFKSAILLQGGLLNSDAQAEYNDAGGTPLMIAHYLRYMYKDDVNKVPARGISGKVIIESAAHNEKIVKADISNITSRIAIATTRARGEAFKTVAHRYVCNKIDRERPDAPAGEKAVAIERIMASTVKNISGRILHHDIAFLDAALMLIVECDYTGTFVEQMYNKLGTAYLAKINAAEDGKVSDLDLQVAGMEVVAEMVSGFITNKLVDSCVCKDETNKSPIVPEV
jgi:hypothetical protein